MFSDPLILPTVEYNHPDVLQAVSNHGLPSGEVLRKGIVDAAYRVNDLSPGKTVRVAVPTDRPEHKLRMTIAHTLSKENAPLQTLRSTIRLDDSFVDASSRNVTSSAYLVVVSPQGLTTAQAPALHLLEALALLSLFGGRKSLAANSSVANTEPFIGRFLTGEP